MEENKNIDEKLENIDFDALFDYDEIDSFGEDISVEEFYRLGAAESGAGVK